MEDIYCIYDTYQCICVLWMYISLNLHTHICAYVPMKIDTVYIYVKVSNTIIYLHEGCKCILCTLCMHVVPVVVGIAA